MRAWLLLLFTICTTAALAAPATELRVTLPPTVIYFQPFNFTVEAIDGTGAVDTTYTSTVAFTAPGDSQATLPQPYTFTAADAGVHVFSATLTVYGDNRSLVVHDTYNSGRNELVTTNVRYGPGATQRLVITAPATGNLGDSFNFTVTAADINGNPTGDYTGTVEFDSHGVTMPSSYTFVPADGGSKTFSGTITRGGRVIFNVHDAAYPGILGNTEMQISCPGFTVTAANDGPICPSAAPTLTASTSQTGVTFHWSGPGFWSASGQTVSGLPNYAGEYMVTMSHPNGCTAFATTTVAFTGVPEVVDLTPGNACHRSEKSYAIVDSATNGPYTNLVWTVHGRGTLVSGQGTTTATIAIDFNIQTFEGLVVVLEGTNGTGCSFGEIVGGAAVYPTPVVDIVNTPPSGCGTTHTAHGVGEPLPPFTTSEVTWSVENATITEFGPHDEYIRYIPSGTGDVVITLYATTGYCSYTATKTITPQQAQGGPTASIASASHTICEGDEVQIPVTLTGQAPFTIQWSDGTQQSINASSFTRTVAPNETTHYSIVSVSDANCSGSATGNVEVTTRDAALITQQPRDTAVPRGQRATLTVDVEPDATAIQWYSGQPGDTSNPIDGANSLEFTTPPITQNTLFWVEIQTSCGTQMSNAATVKVESRRRAVRK